MMFTNTCTHCHKTQLIFASQFTGVTRVDGGTRIAYTCWCGEAETMLLGASSPAPAMVAA